MQFFWLLLISLLQMAQIGISSALGSIQSTFPTLNSGQIQLIASMPDILVMIAAILAGKFLGRYQIKYFLIISSACFGLAGLIGLLLHNSYLFVMISSAILGVAIGCMMPAVSIWINTNSTITQRSFRLGIQSSAANMGGIIMTMICGSLPSSKWYMLYLLYLPTLMLIPKFWKTKNSPECHHANSQICKLSKNSEMKIITTFSIIIATFFSLYSVLSMNIVFYLDEFHITSINGGLVIAVSLFGSVCTGLLILKMKKIFKQSLVEIGILFLAIGLILLGCFHDIFLILVSSFIAGSSLSIVMSEYTNTLVNKLSPETVGSGVSIMLACSDGGGFITPIYSFFQESYCGYYKASSVFLITGILSMLLLLSVRVVITRTK